MTFLHGLFLSGPNELVGMEHQDFTLWAFHLSCGRCPALGSKGFVQVRAGGNELHELSLDQKTVRVNTPEII